METNYYPINKLSNYMLYDTILDKSKAYKIINGVKHIDLNSCKTWLKKD